MHLPSQQRKKFIFLFNHHSDFFDPCMPLPSVFMVTAANWSLKCLFCPSYRQAPRVSLLPHFPSFFLLSDGLPVPCSPFDFVHGHGRQRGGASDLWCSSVGHLPARISAALAPVGAAFSRSAPLWGPHRRASSKRARRWGPGTGCRWARERWAPT
jgi:hypothetical protein